MVLLRGGRSTMSQTWFLVTELISYLIAVNHSFEVGEINDYKKQAHQGHTKHA